MGDRVALRIGKKACARMSSAVRMLLCASAVCGCSGSTSPDCSMLVAQYAAAFADAQRCVPGQDTCTAHAPPVVDGGIPVACDCNTGGNVNPARAAQLNGPLSAYTARCFAGPACLCAIPPDGGWPNDTCRALADGGGLCSP